MQVESHQWFILDKNSLIFFKFTFAASSNFITLSCAILNQLLQIEHNIEK